MEHSDELTFAEYFKSRYDLFRGLISFVVAMQWLIPTIHICLLLSQTGDYLNQNVCKDYV